MGLGVGGGVWLSIRLIKWLVLRWLGWVWLIGWLGLFCWGWVILFSGVVFGGFVKLVGLLL